MPKPTHLTRGNKRAYEDHDDPDAPLRAARRQRRENLRQPVNDEVATMATRIATLEAENQTLRQENQTLRGEIATLRDDAARLGRELDQAQADRPARDAAQAGQPRAIKKWSAEDVELTNLPAELRNALGRRRAPGEGVNPAVADFYRLGGYVRNGVVRARAGSSLERFRQYEPNGGVTREATPEEQSRDKNVDLAAHPGRIYFEINGNEHEDAAANYNLVREERAGSRWEHVQAIKANVLYYADDEPTKRKALQRWPTISETDGRITPVPGRFNPRVAADRGR